MSNTFRWEGEKVKKHLRHIVIEALHEIGAEWLAESQRLCPKQRGFNGGLVSTGEFVVNEEDLSVRVKYKAPHAWLQHEKRNYKHKNGEQSHYVSTPKAENAKHWTKRIADALGGKVR